MVAVEGVLGEHAAMPPMLTDLEMVLNFRSKISQILSPLSVQHQISEALLLVDGIAADMN